MIIVVKISFLLPALLCYLLQTVVISVKSYQHEIPITGKCQPEESNHNVFMCSSLQQVFDLLSQRNNSISIVLPGGNYNLTSSHNVTDVDHIQIRSEIATAVTVQCNFGTGITFIKVTNLTIEHISFTGCGIRHIGTNMVRSALFVLNSTNISLYNMSIVNSNGIGLLMYDTDGTVNITEVSFISNKQNVSERQSSSAGGSDGGGGIHIKFTNFSPGHVDYDSNSNPRNRNANYVIDKCSFHNNSAGSGGGIFVGLYGDTHFNTFLITQSSFSYNSAVLGGGINIRITQNASYNIVNITHCSFTNNTCISEGGSGAGVLMGYDILKDNCITENNQFIIDNCSFKCNQAGKGVGGGISMFGSRVPNTLESTNNFAIRNSTFIKNEALYGSAVETNRQYSELIMSGSLFTLIIENCSFINNSLKSPKSLKKTAISSVGAVATSDVKIVFKGNIHFSGNNSTALAVEGALVEFYSNSVIEFYDNSGKNGGGVLLTNDAWINIYRNCSVKFIRNTAIHDGGAIYVKMSTHFDYVLSRVCFVRYYKTGTPLEKWNFTFTFINNSAGENNNAVYACNCT